METIHSSARPWLPFDQFIQGFKTFLRARPPGFVSFPRFFSILSTATPAYPRSLFRHGAGYAIQPTSRERNFLRRWRVVQIELWTPRTYNRIELYNRDFLERGSRVSFVNFEAAVFHSLPRGRTLRPWRETYTWIVDFSTETSN